MKKAIRIAAFLLVLFAAFGMTGCKKKKLSDEEYMELAEKQAERNRKKVLLRVTAGGETYDVTAYDLVYFLAYNERSALDFKKQQNDYFTATYGSDYNFWEVKDSSGVTVKDSFKESAYASASYAIVFYHEAVAKGMKLEEVRRVAAGTATEKFLVGYSAEQRAKCGMTEACIRECYEKIFLAEQYVEKLSKDYKVDEDAIRAGIDKEDYRVYETDYLYVAKYDRDENFKRVDFTPEESAQRKAAVDDALERVKNGESMPEIKKQYDEIMGYGTSDFFRTQEEEDPEYIKASMKLKKGECTLFERESTYYIIYMSDNEKYSGYEEAVEQAIETEKNTGVASLYKTTAAQYDIAKTEEWEAVEFGKFAIVN